MTEPMTDERLKQLQRKATAWSETSNITWPIELLWEIDRLRLELAAKDEKILRLQRQITHSLTSRTKGRT